MLVPGRIGANIGVLAKIESAESVGNLNAILDAVDGAMVARGDLGAELPVEEVRAAVQVSCHSDGIAAGFMEGHALRAWEGGVDVELLINGEWHPLPRQLRVARQQHLDQKGMANGWQQHLASVSPCDRALRMHAGAVLAVEDCAGLPAAREAGHRGHEHAGEHDHQPDTNPRGGVQHALDESQLHART